MGLSEWLLLLASLLTIIYVWIKHHYSYWRRMNVPYIEPTPIFGNLKEMILMKYSPADHMIALYNHKSAQDQPFVGIHILNQPAVFIRDLELIKSVLIKDFNKFVDRFSSCDSHLDPLGAYNIFFIKSPYWKELRPKLTPFFTSGKMKQMFPLIEEIGNRLDQYLCSLPVDLETNSTIQEVKNICALYTTDVIASVAYGVQANSLKNPNGDFRRHGKALFDFTFYRAFQFSVVFFLPQFVKLFRCTLIPKATATFIRDTINFVMAQRIKSGVVRNDLIDVLVSFQNEADDVKNKGTFTLTNDMMVAQAAVFYVAGFETASSLMAFAIYELAKNPELQKRLRQEIKEALVKTNGKITYDMLNEMEYLNMVTQEVLRLYPPISFLERKCTLTKGEKAFSMEPYSDFGVPHGMPVYIPIYAIHRDPKYFPNPEEFDPERFSTENKPNLIPNTYMPFGVGPHNCIGERLGILQSKVGIINYLKNHYATTCEKSHQKMVLDPMAIIIVPKGGVHCKLVRDPLLR